MKKIIFFILTLTFSVCGSFPKYISGDFGLNKTFIFKRLYFYVFIFLIAGSAYGKGYELPLFNPDLMTFFSSESRYMLSNTIMEYPEDIFQFGSGGWFDDADGNKVLEVVTGFIFPLNENIAIPIYFSVLSNSPEMTYFPMFWPIDPTYFERFTGSGLILNTEWLMLGMYVGYYELTQENDIEKNKSTGINYAIVPVIKLDIWYLKKIEHFFNTSKVSTGDASDDKTSFSIKDIQFYTKLVFEGFNLFNQNNNSFEPYFSRSNYDWVTKNTIYGTRIGLNRLGFEGGYRIFDDTYSNSYFFAVQLRFSAFSVIQEIFKNEECFISFSMDNYYKKIGIGIADLFSKEGGNGIIMIEAVVNDRSNVSIVAYTQKTYLNWSEWSKY